jgi:hypothetical protein
MSDETKGGKPIDEPGDAGSRDHRDGMLSDLAGRILRVGAEAVSVGAEKLREKGESAASLTARGKEEVMTLFANEIRSYIEKLKVGDEIRSFLDDYTLEVKASVRLKAQEPGEEVPPDDSGVSVEVGFEPVSPPVEEPVVEEPPEPAAVPTAELPAPSRATTSPKPVTATPKPVTAAKTPAPGRPAAKTPTTKKKRTRAKKRTTAATGEPKE